MAVSHSDGFENLLSLFKDGLDLYNNLGRTDEPTNSPSIQINVKRCIKTLERATNLVSLAGIFGGNEDIEELPTEHIQYLLLPALLGSLTLKLTSGDRREIVDIAEIYFKDFLRRTNNYNLSNYKFKEETKEEAMQIENQSTQLEQLTRAVNVRANKIQRFKEQKELKQMLETLKENLNNEHVDEDIKRKYYLTLIKSFIYEAVDELNSIDMEKPILEHMATLKKGDSPQLKRLPPPLKPIIITRDAVQKAVYGAGYPSLPTMTVQEFYDKRVGDGIFPDPTKPRKGPMSLQEASLAGLSLRDEKEAEEEETEKKIDEDDEQYLENQRNKDDFKDDHRRGWGNRYNRS